MIDARECEAMARQCEEQAAEAIAEAERCKAAAAASGAMGASLRADRWSRVAAALNDAGEAFHRAANEIEAVSTER